MSRLHYLRRTSRFETLATKTKGKRKKPAKATVEVLSSSDEERSAKKSKYPRQCSIADAIVEVEKIRDASRRREIESITKVRKMRIEADQKQRDQQHAILLQRDQERFENTRKDAITSMTAASEDPDGRREVRLNALNPL